MFIGLVGTTDLYDISEEKQHLHCIIMMSLSTGPENLIDCWIIAPWVGGKSQAEKVKTFLFQTFFIPLILSTKLSISSLLV